MTDDFDDDALRDAIRARSGGPVDPGPGLQTVTARAARVRTRRNAVVGGAATAAVVAGLVLLPTSGGEQPATSDASLPPVSVDVTAPSTRPSPTMATTTADTTSDVVTIPPSPDSGVESGEDTTAPTTSASTVASPTTAAPSAPAATVPSSSAAPVPTDPPPTTPPAVITPSTTPDSEADAPFTREYSSIGGSITVRWDGSALSLISVTPNAGYDSEIEDQSASRIRVRFRGDDDDARIEVRADDGQVEASIS
mgnify:CR=1 FL=1